MIGLRISQGAYVQCWETLLRRVVQCVVCERTARQLGYAEMARTGWTHKLGRGGLHWTCPSCRSEGAP